MIPDPPGPLRAELETVTPRMLAVLDAIPADGRARSATLIARRVYPDDYRGDSTGAAYAPKAVKARRARVRALGSTLRRLVAAGLLDYEPPADRNMDGRYRRPNLEEAHGAR